jgi:diguanylate cyclase (GGDEF)-like protein
MMEPVGSTEPRLLVITDLDRLGPIVRDCFAPNRIVGVRSYLSGIAEIVRAPTRAILVGFDPACRKPEAAIAAMKSVAGDAPVVFCCEPAYESLGRKLLDHGADDYVIFPPEAIDLERALRVPSRKTQQRWIETPSVAPVPTAEELARLADVLPRLTSGDPSSLDAMAALICTALNAGDVTIVLQGRTGRAGPGADASTRPVLVEPIVESEQRIGQIRVGASRSGSYTHEDTAKLRHYGVLFGRLVEGAGKAEQWRKLAETDDLTGLPNRRRLMQFLNEKVALAEKTRTTLTVLYFDIDDFKRYNDAYGHDAGDEILCDIGRLFVKCTRDSDMVSRYGGDEFVVVFWDPEGPRTAGSHHPERVMQIVERFRAALKKHTFRRLGPEATGCLTISGGIAHYPWDGRSGPELVEIADRALLQAKDGGKNRFAVLGDTEPHI